MELISYIIYAAVLFGGGYFKAYEAGKHIQSKNLPRAATDIFMVVMFVIFLAVNAVAWSY